MCSLTKSPFSILRVGPVGVATRKYSFRKCLFVDLSAPDNSSIPINSLIPLEPFSLFNASIDNAVQTIKKAGVSVRLSKSDSTDAFKDMSLCWLQRHRFWS